MNKIENIILGNIYGGAFGDSIGGPIEMEGREHIKSVFSIENPFMDYPEEKINPHGAHKIDKGTITDDTRLKLLLVDTFIENSTINKELINKKIIEEYHTVENSKLYQAWLEEYYFNAIFSNKQFLGGMQANAGAMCSSVFGLFYLGDSYKAFRKACELPFVSSYGMYAAGFIASLTSTFIFENNIQTAIKQSLDDLIQFKGSYESSEWRNSDFYKYCNMEIENVINKIMSVDIKSMSEEEMVKFLDDNFLQKYQYDAAETIAIVLVTLIKFESDFDKAVEFAIKFGRDNDSSASIVGAIIGSKLGIDCISTSNQEILENANKEYRIKQKCNLLSEVIQLKIDIIDKRVCNIKEL